jgi:3-methylfumaryl-CoA hydratase
MRPLTGQGDDVYQANDYQAWVGRSETTDDTVTTTPVRALRALLDRDDAPVERGDVLPPLWHWLYFLPLHRQSLIGPDGHPRRGGFLPPVPLPRRMWAGSRFEFHAPLRVGDALRRVSTIEAVNDKQGRSGRLVFVTVRHELFAGGTDSPALREWHDIVYREAQRADDPVVAPKRAPEAAAWSDPVTPDAVLLFRYSALTFNGHRIHYDRDYATGVEGYPGLVVHGPLIATLLLEGLHRHRPGAALATFEFKAQRATFDGPRFAVHGQPSDDGRSLRLWASDHDGWLTMDATATLR